MIIREHRPDCVGLFNDTAALIARIYSDGGTTREITPADLLFFDIETTGLSPDTSYLYLIGCMYFDNGAVIHKQFMAESVNEESGLIEAYYELLGSRSVLVNFNGCTFDIPYIDKKALRFGIANPNPGIGVFDLYSCLRRYKKLFGLGSMKQKSLEIFCGLNRRDTFDGGELIEVYSRFIALRRLEEVRLRSTLAAYSAVPGSGLTQAGSSSSDELLNILLLHNYEDVLGMLSVAVLLVFPLIASGHCRIVGSSVSDTELKLSAAPDCGSLAGLQIHEARIDTCERDDIILCVNDASGTFDISIPLLRTELKHYYPDYRNYYYLPAEDTAVYKSIGEFMDKSLRVKCTAANCYTRHTLDFVPFPAKHAACIEDGFTVFKREPRSNAFYVNAAEVTASEESAKRYLAHLFE